ncbi:VanW family protein [Paenibacillus abyssi]|uniref:Peptidoglycan binding domain-containing protein n=1 Tax=Paenibacillus abyssi TaxID=1340531 RepID=A0A917FY16_9BACL|nr:VanW family protein [Paenibacillus abyssi]GGG13490.1 hypothetical protein GCM10010916_32990 [Paenibacillus abyssi]
MKLLWLAGLLLLLPSGNGPDQLIITFQGQAAITVDRDEFTLPGTSMIDLEKLDSLLNLLDKRIYQEPQNAHINGQGQIIPEQLGQRLDRKRFTQRFFNYYFGEGFSVIAVPRETIYPKVDQELLAQIREKPIGQYVTYFNMRNKNRSHNITLAAKAINNVVVFPGETFSFNQVVGKRTKEKGYLQAPVIVRGELSEGIGGGICQVSSTLFNATDRAGLKIVQRYSHSRNVPYVLPGRDATVSWYGPDFVFQNHYNQPILIRAYAAGGRMFVSIYSSDLIEYKPREIPGISGHRLPEEISITALLAEYVS